MFLWLMNGTERSSGRSYLDPISTDWHVQGVADFNGDGRSDILWRNVNARRGRRVRPLHLDA